MSSVMKDLTVENAIFKGESTYLEQGSRIYTPQ